MSFPCCCCFPVVVFRRPAPFLSVRLSKQPKTTAKNNNTAHRHTKGSINMAYVRYFGNVIITFLFAAFLWVVAIVATRSIEAANTAFWIGLIIGMVAIQADVQKRT